AGDSAMDREGLRARRPRRGRSAGSPPGRRCHLSTETSIGRVGPGMSPISQNHAIPPEPPLQSDIARHSLASAVLPPHYVLFVIALALGVLIVYQPVWNGGFLWDCAAHVPPADLRSWQRVWRWRSA